MNKRESLATLCLNENSSQEEIKKSYRKLAMKHHPDKGGDEKTFKKITEAYDNLTKSSKDDSELHGDFHEFFNAHDMFNNFFRNMDINANANVNGNMNGNTRKMYKKNIQITMEEAYNGVTKTIGIDENIECVDCKAMCEKCNGKGHYNVEQRRQLGFACVVNVCTVKCDKCKGTGKNLQKQKEHCTVCNNTKTYVKRTEINVVVAKGVDKDYVEVFKDALKDGDLHIRVEIKYLKNYKLVNNILTYVCKIDFIDSIFGVDIAIEHPSGEESTKINTININEIMRTDKPFIIRNKGMSHSKDLHVIFDVNYPKIDKKHTSITKCKEDLLSLIC